MEDPKLLKRAKAMRREPTPAEQKLWTQLRDRRLDGLKFRRQVPLGPFIVDFLCKERNLVVEVDGGQHVDSGYDADCDRWLTAQGHRVLRLWNAHVLEDVESALEHILIAARGGEPPAG